MVQSNLQHFRDLLLAGITFGMPAYFVFRSRRFGVLLGAAGLWLLVLLCGEVSYTWDGSPPQENRSYATEEWLMGGWLFGLAYGYLVWLVKEACGMCWRGFLAYQQMIHSGVGAKDGFLETWRELNRGAQFTDVRPQN